MKKEEAPKRKSIKIWTPAHTLVDSVAVKLQISREDVASRAIVYGMPQLIAEEQAKISLKKFTYIYRHGASGKIQDYHVSAISRQIADSQILMACPEALTDTIRVDVS